MKTLAMLKMEKNLVAVIEKKYPRNPYEVASTSYLLSRLNDEYIEVLHAYGNKDVENLREELADMSNIIDFIFERVSEGHIK